MKIKIKEFHFESGLPNPKWWQLVLGILIVLATIFNDKILGLFQLILSAAQAAF